jgi:hypothetical protein
LYWRVLGGVKTLVTTMIQEWEYERENILLQQYESGPGPTAADDGQSRDTHATPEPPVTNSPRSTPQQKSTQAGYPKQRKRYSADIDDALAEQLHFPPADPKIKERKFKDPIAAQQRRATRLTATGIAAGIFGPDSTTSGFTLQSMTANGSAVMNQFYPPPLGHHTNGASSTTLPSYLSTYQPQPSLQHPHNLTSSTVMPSAFTHSVTRTRPSSVPVMNTPLPRPPTDQTTTSHEPSTTSLHGNMDKQDDPVLQNKQETAHVGQAKIIEQGKSLLEADQMEDVGNQPEEQKPRDEKICREEGRTRVDDGDKEEAGAGAEERDIPENTRDHEEERGDLASGTAQTGEVGTVAETVVDETVAEEAPVEEGRKMVDESNAVSRPPDEEVIADTPPHERSPTHDSAHDNGDAPVTAAKTLSAATLAAMAKREKLKALRHARAQNLKNSTCTLLSDGQSEEQLALPPNI